MFPCSDIVIYPALNRIGHVIEGSFGWDDDDPNKVVVMQFTGLKDKNGREIYESDIVRILYTDWASKSADDPRTLDEYLDSKSHIGVVEFVGAAFEIAFGKDKYGGGSYGSIHHGQHGRITVIGNIYENPELLK